MNTQFFKIEGNKLFVLSGGDWKDFGDKTEGRLASEIITEKLRDLYSEEQSKTIEKSDPESSEFVAYWAKVHEIQKEVLDDLASFEKLKAEAAI